MKNKSVTQRIFNQIMASNKRFAKMPKAQQRVKVARDALALLSSGFLSQGALYVTSNYCLRPETVFSDLSEAIKTLPDCQVCAKGALFVGCLLRFDKFPASGYCCNADFIISGRETDKYVVDKNQLFSRSQFDLIENHFERNVRPSFFAREVDGIPFNRRQIRLELILQNIVVNKGTFKPHIAPIKYRGRWKMKGYRAK